MRLLPSRSAALRLTASALARLATPCCAVFTSLFVLLLALGSAQAALAQAASFVGSSTTVASGFQNLGLVSTDPFGNAYVTDFTAGTITEIYASGAPPKVVVSGLDSPIGVSADGSGNLYVGAYYPDEEIKIAPGGAQTVLAKLPNSPTGSVVDANGDVFATVWGSSVVKISPSGQTSTVTSGDYYASALDSAGNLYTSDSGNKNVHFLSADGVTTNTYFSGLGDPQGVAVDGAGNIFVAARYSGVYERVAATGAIEKIGSFTAPVGVATDAAGDLFVSDFSSGSVTKIQFQSVNFGSVNVCPAGQNNPAPCSQTQTLNYSITSNGAFGAPVALTQGAPGLDFSVTGSTCMGPLTEGAQCTVTVAFTPKYPGARNGAVELVDATGNVVASTLVYGAGLGPQLAFSSGTQTTVSTSGSNNPKGIAVDGAGDLFFTSNSNVIELAANGTQTTLLNALQNPVGLALDGAGNLFIADSVSSSLLELPAGQRITHTVGSGLSDAVAVAIDGAGDLFVAESLNNRVVEVIAGSGAQVPVGSGFSHPTGVAVDGAGNVFVTDDSNERVVEVPAGGGAQFTVGSGFRVPFGVAVDSAGNVYVADESLRQVIEVPANGGAQFTLAGGFNEAFALTLDAAGDIFVTDPSSGRLVELNRAQAPSFSFAATTVGSTSTDSPMSTQIQNIGNQPLSALPPGLAIRGPFNQVSGSGEFTDCSSSFSLTPGALCNLSIDFTPQQLGVSQGSATFTDNSLNNTSPAAQQIIALSGTGNPEQDTVTFTNPTQGASYAYGQSFQASATATNTAATITYSASSGYPVSVTPAGAVMVTGVGGATLLAKQAASGNYAAGSGSVAFNAVQATANPVLFGSMNSNNTGALSVTVKPQYTGTPTGNVTFYNGSTALGTVALVNGQASYMTGTYTGAQNFSATYLGDTNFTNAPSNTVSLSFPVAPTITFTVANQTYGAAPFQVSASSNSQGAITYSVLSGPATISGSTVTLTGAGTVQLQASQATSGGYLAGSSTATFTVSKAATTTMLSGAIIPGTNTATLTASVAPQTAGTYPAALTGSVTFYNNGTSIGTGTIVAGKATLTTAAYTNVQSFTAVYSGDTNYNAAPTSNTATLTFTVAPTITFATAATYAYGQNFQLAATSNSSGTFTYALVSGPATVTAAGAVTITGEGAVVVQASEAAAPGYNAGSKQANFTAVQATSATTLTATTVKSGYGSAASLSATVAPQFTGTPTGSVTFYDATTMLATVTLSGGKASYTTSQLVGAQHAFSAVYSGDTNFLKSTSNTANLTIAVTAVSLQVALTRLIYPLSSPVFQVVVSPASGKPAPTGTVTVYDGTTAVGSYPLYALTSGNLLGLVLPPLNVGTHPLVAFYSGDANYPPGTSATVTVTVVAGLIH